MAKNKAFPPRAYGVRRKPCTEWRNSLMASISFVPVIRAPEMDCVFDFCEWLSVEEHESIMANANSKISKLGRRVKEKAKRIEELERTNENNMRAFRGARDRVEELEAELREWKGLRAIGGK